jgi:hypothetical protein
VPHGPIRVRAAPFRPPDGTAEVEYHAPVFSVQPTSTPLGCASSWNRCRGLPGPFLWDSTQPSIVGPCPARSRFVRAARYWGPWSFSPATFSNAYYKNLLEYSPYPHQDPRGSRNCTSTLECARGFSGRRGKAGPVSCPSPAFRFRPRMHPFKP